MLNTNGFFECIYNNAKQNGIFIMSNDGIIQQVNEAFTTAYGYTTEDLQSKHFRCLYVEKDQVTRRPELELSTVGREGASTDENYLVHKDGTPIWVTGESILIRTDDASCIVKIVHNIHAQKQLERYLLASSELLDSLFDSVRQSGLLLLDTQMKTIRANEAFKKMFGLDQPILQGSRLQQIGHSFWSNDEIKNEIRNAIVNGSAINKEYTLSDSESQSRRLHVASKLIVTEDIGEKKLLLITKEI